VCLKAKEKHKSQANQAGNKTKTLLSFFSKVTHSPKEAVATKGGSTHTNAKVLTKVRSLSAHTPTPTLPPNPLPLPLLSYLPCRLDSAETESYGCQHPDAYALALLARLDHAAQELPLHVPEAEANDEIACILSVEDPNDPSEAWEYLDPALNRLLGYGSSVEDIIQRMQRGPLGVAGLSCLICRFVVQYGIAGSLLEGKLNILFSAIDTLKE
jgi:hypothetical protein